jgi:hypothetical protein
MLHSPEKMGQMLSRKPDEENGEPTIQQHGATVSKWLRAHGHEELAQKVESLGEEHSTPAAEPQQEQSYADSMARVRDHAKNILWRDMSEQGSITKAAASDAWDAYYNATSLDDLAKRLQSLPLPDVTKHNLYVAFQEHRAQSAPKASALDRVTESIKKITTLPSDHLETAEGHRHVFEAISKALGIGGQKKKEE